MTEKRITIATADEQIKQLYETAFPVDEQIPWDDLMRLVGEMPLDFTAYYDGEVMEQREQRQACLNSAESRENPAEGQTFIGFTIVYPRKSFNWFWYFAVREELRGKGYGQQILTQLIERYKGQPFVLDMESTTQVCDNLEQRKQRQAFYLRNGFRDTNVYRTYNDTTMTIMMRGEDTLASPSSDATQPSSSELGRPSLLPRFTMQDWDDIIRELQQFWWPDDIKEG